MITPSKLINSLRKTDRYIEIIYTHGGCYKFYEFLKSIYPEAEAYLSPQLNHVITKIDNNFYDITGKLKKKEYQDYIKLRKDHLPIVNKWGFGSNNWISLGECENCGELIKADDIITIKRKL